ncbi:hypothetical protein [Leptospira noguchii]|uniref:hypothetical protein n=1 Tax=Leptospira noguchii TaxID=28182 RepID=UPI001FB70CA4|nr:hypothetical protein [Leptospira noguchii]UOG52461.1 hypothetical protein MAL09_18135 [Leptospira noguchii]
MQKVCFSNIERSSAPPKTWENSTQRFLELSVSLLLALEVTQRLASRVARQVALETQHNAFLNSASHFYGRSTGFRSNS